MMPTNPCPFDLALHAWPAIWLVDLLRYLVAASIVALVIARLPSAWRSRRHVRPRSPTRDSAGASS